MRASRTDLPHARTSRHEHQLEAGDEHIPHSLLPHLPAAPLTPRFPPTLSACTSSPRGETARDVGKAQSKRNGDRFDKAHWKGRNKRYTHRDRDLTRAAMHTNDTQTQAHSLIFLIAGGLYSVVALRK